MEPIKVTLSEEYSIDENNKEVNQTGEQLESGKNK